jgi:hypothetical protein
MEELFTNYMPADMATILSYAMKSGFHGAVANRKLVEEWNSTYVLRAVAISRCLLNTLNQPVQQSHPTTTEEFTAVPDQFTVEESTTGESTDEESAAGQSIAEESAAGQSTPEESAAGQSIAEESAAGQSTPWQSAVEQPAGGGEWFLQQLIEWEAKGDAKSWWERLPSLYATWVPLTSPFRDEASLSTTDATGFPSPNDCIADDTVADDTIIGHVGGMGHEDMVLYFCHVLCIGSILINFNEIRSASLFMSILEGFERVQDDPKKLMDWMVAILSDSTDIFDEFFRVAYSGVGRFAGGLTKEVVRGMTYALFALADQATVEPNSFFHFANNHANHLPDNLSSENKLLIKSLSPVLQQYEPCGILRLQREMCALSEVVATEFLVGDALFYDEVVEGEPKVKRHPSPFLSRLINAVLFDLQKEEDGADDT